MLKCSDNAIEETAWMQQVRYELFKSHIDPVRTFTNMVFDFVDTSRQCAMHNVWLEIMD